MPNEADLPPIRESSQPVIPPIISNEKDRDFLIQLNGFIENELGKVDNDNEEQRYIIYKAAFDKVSDKFLLASCHVVAQ